MVILQYFLHIILLLGKYLFSVQLKHAWYAARPTRLAGWVTRYGGCECPDGEIGRDINLMSPWLWMMTFSILLIVSTRRGLVSGAPQFCVVCVVTKVLMLKLRIANGQQHYTGHPDLQLLLQPHTRGSILRKSSLTVLDFVFCPQIDNNVQKQNTDKMFRTIWP